MRIERVVECLSSLFAAVFLIFYDSLTVTACFQAALLLIRFSQ